MTDPVTPSKRALEAAENIALLLRVDGPREPIATIIDNALAVEREQAAKVADKKAETLRKAAHVVQQPTADALRMAELAILTADDIATTIRNQKEGNNE